MYQFLDRDVMVCEDCQRPFRPTGSEAGWRVENGRLLCKRCPSLFVPIALLLMGAAAIAYIWLAQS